MILNEIEALTNLANVPIIFTYYAERELSISSIHYIKLKRFRNDKKTKFNTASERITQGVWRFDSTRISTLERSGWEANFEKLFEHEARARDARPPPPSNTVILVSRTVVSKKWMLQEFGAYWQCVWRYVTVRNVTLSKHTVSQYACAVLRICRKIKPCVSTCVPDEIGRASGTHVK